MSDRCGRYHTKKFQDFAAVDRALSNVGVSSEDKLQIYEILAGILHLGNVIFEEDTTSGKCKVADRTKNHIKYAAELLRIDQQVLEASLLTRDLEVNGSDSIM